MFLNDLWPDKDNIFIPRPPFFFFFIRLHWVWVGKGMEGHTLSRIKEALCALTDIALFHTLRLYSIFSLSLCSSSHDSNPIISLSAPPPRPYCLSSRNLCSHFSAQYPCVTLNVFISSPPFYFLPSLFSFRLSSPTVAAPLPTDPLLSGWQIKVKILFKVLGFAFLLL